MSEIKEGDYKIHINQDNVVIKHKECNKVLVIDKQSCAVSEKDQSFLSKQKFDNVFQPHAILGILDCKAYIFLIYVEVCELVGKIEGAEVFKVLNIGYVSLFDLKTQPISEKLKAFLDETKNLLTMGFYYSFNYDLTNTRQIQVKNKNHNILDSSDKNFFWNYAINQKLLDAQVDPVWTVVCIFGYVNIANIALGNEKATFTLISRRSVNHAGTRYNARGITEEGNVANYVETEQMLRIRKRLFAFTIIRGSVPVYFEQNPVNSETTILKNTVLTSEAFVLHVNQIQQHYKYVMMQNLMTDTKQNEEVITSAFKNMFRVSNLNNCKYDSFDVHVECKNDNYDNLENLVTGKLANIINNFKYYNEDGDSGKIQEQSGIFRVNCLDCLDRTNLFQTMVGWHVLMLQV